MCFIDSFPCNPAAPLFTAHQVVDECLRANEGLTAARSSLPTVRFQSIRELGENRRKDVFAAALERLEWLQLQPDPLRSRFGVALHCIIGMTGWSVSDGITAAQHLTQEELLRLVRLGPLLHRNSGGHDFHQLPAVVLRSLRDPAIVLTPELAEALDVLVDHLVRVHSHGAETFDIALRLFRAGWASIPWAPEEMCGPDWKALMELSDHHWTLVTPIDRKSAAKLGKAITRIGTERVGACIDRAIRNMEANQPTPLSAAGMTLLRQMLRWVQAEPKLAVDEALYRLSGLRWEPAVAKLGLMKEWLGAHLEALATRSTDRAFACIERLAHNPDTMQYREVIHLYNGFLRAMTVEGKGEVYVGVDGFPVETEWHRILDNLLAAGVPRTAADGGVPIASTLSNRSTHVEVAVRRGQANPVALLRAMHERVRWLAQREPTVPSEEERFGHRANWAADFRTLYVRLLELKPTRTREDLIALCQADGGGWLQCRFTESLLNVCTQWIAQQGFDGELTAAMRVWERTVHGGAYEQGLRKRIGWLLWFDPTAPIAVKSCWSAVIRQDLRAMPAPVSGAWIALLGNASFGTAVQPTKRWQKSAGKLLAAVGAEGFRTCVRRWFAVFRESQPLKITVAGRDVLGALLWYSQLAADPAVDEAVRWYATAKWQTKADRERTARLLPIWVYTLAERSPDVAVDTIHTYRATGQLLLIGKTLAMYRSLCQGSGRAPEIEPPPPPSAFDREAWLARQMGELIAGMLGQAGQLTNEALLVTNAVDGERYEIALRGGRIVRLSDARVVRLEIDPENPMTGMFQPMIDHQDLADPLGKNYHRAMLCGQILAGLLPLDVPIVVDES